MCLWELQNMTRTLKGYKGILNDFKLYLEEFSMNYSLPGESDLKKLARNIKRQSISINKISKNISSYIDNDFLNEIEKYFTQMKNIQFSLPENQKWIKNGLARELSRVISGEKERIKVSLEEDIEYNRATEIILNLKEYYSLLEY